MNKRISTKLLKLSVLKSLVVSGYIFIIFFCLSILDHKLLLTSLGASAFIAFAFPLADSARPRYMIGGYICAVAAGILFAVLREKLQLDSNLGTTFCCTCAVFVVIFLMTIFNFEHPPSVAVALSIVLSDCAIKLAVVAVIGVLLLCLWRVIFVRLPGLMELERERASIRSNRANAAQKEKTD